MIIGSHVSMSGKDMLLGSVKEALSYGANTFMFYTGAPQNTRRKAISELKVEEAKALMKENNIDLKNVVVHAPYIINLANTVKEETFELAVNFLKQELQRCQDIGTSILVLHPGSHVKAGEEVGLQQIIKGLNEVLKDTPYQGKIALETMAGKGLPIIQEYIYDRNLQLTLQAGSQALNYFLSLPAAPTAIICCNDIIALGALNAAYSLGLKIPADMSIVGFDNVISNLHQPQITTVQQNLREISLELFELVVNPPEDPVSKIIEASFIEGATCSRIETAQK